MRVRLETAGGYVGLPRVAELDTDEVPSLDVGAVLAALSECEGGPPPPGPQPRYRLTVYGDGGAPRVVELTEPAVPPAVRPLLTELLSRARPAG
ncbi:MAG: protealysin inhibitor emfourin [Kineosporiaceae bacterium]